MSKIQKIFLDNYESCAKTEADLVIYPEHDQYGNELPALFFKRRKPLDLVTSLDPTPVWEPYMKFDILVSQDQYNKFVDWWFDNISDDYSSILVDMAGKAIEYDFDVTMSVTKARNKLKIVPQEERKSNLGKFLSNWIGSGAAYWIRKKTGERI
jgi:hypothetical protein